MRKTVLFFCLLILGTIAISDCPGENTEEVFLNVGEQKIFNLNTMYRELDKLLITKNATQQFGRVQDGDVLLKSPVQLSFASYSDYVVLNDEEFNSFIRVGILGLHEKQYFLNVVDFPKYSSSPVQPKIISQQQMFAGDDSPNTKWCFSLDFVDVDTIVVDCAYEATPQVIENVFFVVEFDYDITTTTKYPNLNIGQFNSIQKRKIRIIDEDDTSTVFIRAHLQTDVAHENSTYVEIFNYTGDAIRLDGKINRDKEDNQWKIGDFATTEYNDLIVLANGRFVVLTIDELYLNLNSMILPVDCLVTSFTVTETNEDSYMIYAACDKDIKVYKEEVNMWFPFFKSSLSVSSLQVVTDYLIVNQQNQSVIVDRSSGYVHTILPQKDSGSLLSTSIENEVICIELDATVRQGEILPELLILTANEVTAHPEIVQVYADDNGVGHCIARFEITVEPTNSVALISVDHQTQPLYELNSNEVRWTSRECHIPFSELVDGPDVNFSDEMLEFDEDYFTFDSINQETYSLRDYNITLGNTTKVLAMNRVSNVQVQVFIIIEDAVNVFDCILVAPDGYNLDDVKCKPYEDVLIPGKDIADFQSVHSKQFNHTTIGVRYQNQTKQFYLLTRLGMGLGRLQTVESDIPIDQFLLGHHFLVTYGKGVSDLTIYDLDLDESSFDEMYAMIPQQHFFDLLGNSNPISWCITAGQTSVFVVTEKQIIELDHDDDEWVLRDVFSSQQIIPEFCHVIDKQLYVGASDKVFIYGVDPSLYYRGELNLYNQNVVNSMSTHRYLYLQLSNGDLAQYSADRDQSLSGALVRILKQIDYKSFVPVTLQDIEVAYKIGVEEGSNQIGSQLLIMAHTKKLVVFFDEESNDFIMNINFNVTFTNHFNQSLKVGKAEQVVSSDPSLIALNNTQNITVAPTQNNVPQEVYIDPTSMFKGPSMSMYIVGSLDKFQFNERVHHVGRSVVYNLTDFTFYLNKESLETISISKTSVQLRSGDLSKITKKIDLLDDTIHVALETIHYDKDSNAVYVTSFDSSKEPISIFYGDLSKGSDNLSFNEIHLEQDWQRVIKTRWVGPYYIILYSGTPDIKIKVLKPYKDNAQEVLEENLQKRLLNMTSIVDFDAHLTDHGLHLILLDSMNGVSILEYKKNLRGRLLQLSEIKEFNIREQLIHNYNQVLFADTQFNGIHALKDLPDKNNLIRTFITTTNTLQHQLNFDTKGSSFSYVSSFMRLSDYPTVEQSVAYIPEQNTVVVVYADTDIDAKHYAAFYNLTAAHEKNNAVPYYQAKEVNERIGGQYIKTVGSLGKTFTSQELSNMADRPNFESKEWPLQGGLIMRDTDDDDMYLMTEIQDLVFSNLNYKPGIVVINGQVNETETLFVAASGVDFTEALYPLSLMATTGSVGSHVKVISKESEHLSTSSMPSKHTEKRKANSMSDRYNIPPQFLRINLLLNNEQFISFLFILVGLGLFLVLFFLVRCVRRSILLRRMRDQHLNEPQEFSSEHL